LVAAGLKVAWTLLAEVRVKVQFGPELESQPDHPAKVDPAAAVAVSETAVPDGSISLQVLPQLIPLPVTVPVPEPVLLTVRA